MTTSVFLEYTGVVGAGKSTFLKKTGEMEGEFVLQENESLVKKVNVFLQQMYKGQDEGMIVEKIYSTF